MPKRSDRKVYADFLTNLAVAWFAAGVIAPVFTPAVNLNKPVLPLLAMFACAVSLRLAIAFQRGHL